MLIGITGKSCSGKNYVASILQRRGFTVWDLDKEAEKIRKRHSKEIKAIFGTCDKKIIADIIFSDKSKRNALENIIYPSLVEKIRSYNYDLIINGATLKRAGLDNICDFIIYVDAPFTLRQKRAILRDNISPIQFEQRENNQCDIAPTDIKYNCPVFTVTNVEQHDSVEEQLSKLL